MNKREQKRNKRAEKVCQELRYIISHAAHETPENWNKLVNHLLSWMRVAKKNKYDRPK